MEKVQVFLGGTCNGSTWRDLVEEELYDNGISYFNPVVEDWNEEAVKIENYHKNAADINLYGITSEMSGVYSIAEMVDDSNKKPEKVIVYILTEGFTDSQLKSLTQVSKLIEKNGGVVIVDDINALINTIRCYLF